MWNNIVRKLITFCSLAIIVAALAAGSSAQTKKDLKRAKDLADQGSKLFNQKNYREAADKYGEAIAIVPNNGYSHFWKGYAHYYLKEPDQAINEFGIALVQGYKPLDVYKVRWFVLYERKNYDGALDDVTRGLAIEPENLNLLRALGEIQYSRNAYPEALAAFQRASKVAPNDGDLYYNIARVHFALNQTAEQADAATEAIKHGTQLLGESYYLLGDAHRKRRNNDMAIDAFQRSIAAKPATYQTYRDLADVYRSESRYPDAIAISKKGLLQFPNDGSIYTDLSWYYSLSDRHEDAVQAAIAGTRLLPNQYMAFTNLCRASNDVKQYAQAITACNSALKLNATDGETLFYLARAYDLTGRTAEATKLYARAVTGLIEFTKSNPDYSDGYYLLGNAYSSDNQRDKAIEAYRRCLQLSPRFARARLNLGLIQAQKRNKSAAMEQYNELVKLDSIRAARLKAEIDKL